MIETRKDFDLLVQATECCRDLLSIEDIEKVLSKEDNLMFISGRNAGLAIYDAPGIYTVHWYYEARGREAINLGKDMIGLLFANHDAKLLRGLIKTKLKASRWACRQLGFKSYGTIMFPENDENEFFCMTKLEYDTMKGVK